MFSFQFKNLYVSPVFLIQLIVWGAVFPITSAESASTEKSWQWGESIDPPPKAIKEQRDKGTQYGVTKLATESIDAESETVQADQQKQKAPVQGSNTKSAKK